MLNPTTTGAGPFKPAINFNDSQWIIDNEYGNEDDAYAEAHVVYTKCCRAFTAELKAAGFRPRAHR